MRGVGVDHVRDEVSTWQVVSEVAIHAEIATKQLAMDSAETASDIQIAATVCTEPVLSWDERHLFFRSHLHRVQEHL